MAIKKILHGVPTTIYKEKKFDGFSLKLQSSKLGNSPIFYEVVKRPLGSSHDKFIDVSLSKRKMEKLFDKKIKEFSKWEN